MDADIVLELIYAFRRSKAMFAAVELHVFDILEGAPFTAAALARQSGYDADAMERLLDACAGLKLLRKQGDTYVNEPVASAYLCRSSSTTLAGYILYSNKVLYPLWEHLEDALKEGTPRWGQAFGLEGSAIFDYFFKTEESMRTFLLGMHGMGSISSPGVVAAFDLSRFHRLVDLGGGTGHLAIAACERYPQMRAAVFDLPRVVEVTRERVSRSPAAARIETVAGDFFQDELPDADLFALARIVHDWSLRKIQPLLRKIFEKLPPGGGLLIAEKLLEDDKTGPLPALMQSLNMLVCTEGKERSAPEYQALLEWAGFGEVQAKRTGTELDAVLAIKP
jgi:acetylserotonin N-methyltransferase